MKRQRLYALLLALGACVLLTRTLIMVSQDALAWLAAWVAGLLIVELVIDAMTLVGALRWAVSGNSAHASFPLRLGAAAAIVHALRVLIYVLGRTGPWYDFDVRQEYLATHGGRAEWFWVWFAAILSVLGIAGVIVIWRLRVRAAVRRSGSSA